MMNSSQFPSSALLLCAAATILGCGKSTSPSAVRPQAPPIVAKPIPPESLPPNPKTLAKIKADFFKSPVRPLPKDADVSQSLRRWQVKTEFWKHLYLNGFRSGKPAGGSPASAEIFLEAYCLRIGESPQAPTTAELLKQGEELAAEDRENPHILLPLAGLKFDADGGSSPRLTEMLRSLDEAIRGGKYSPWLTARYHRLRATVLRSETEGKTTTGVDREQMQLMIDALIRAGSAPDLTNIQRRMLVYLFDNWGPQFHRGQYRVALTTKLDTAKNLDPWVHEILLSRFYQSVAWQARGGGTMDTVTQDGLERFQHYMEHARRHSLRAWELHPELPEAAKEMLDITMATKGAAGEDARFWFDESVQADFNFLDAYLSLAWALRPRWQGSHEKMIAFGDECLATGRFDTDVPFIFHQMISDVAGERGDLETLLKAQGIYERYQLLFEGLAQNAQSDVSRNHHKARLAAVSYAAGKKDKAREILAELKTEVDPRDFELFHLSLEEVRSDLASK